MEDWIPILLPLFLIMGRVTAFFVTAPLFCWAMVPVRIRVAIAILVTIFFAFLLPRPPLAARDVHWIGAVLLLGREVLFGLALGLVARLVFLAVQQGILMGTQQMGFADAGIIDPSTNESGRPAAMLFQMIFAVLFLSIGGHHLLLLTLHGSYEAFPIGQPAEMAVLAEGVLRASVTMFVYGLKLAAPLLAGFLLLSVVMGVIARVMPEMNILMASLPLRVGVGMVLTLLVIQTLNAMVEELAEWIGQFMAFA